MILAPLTDPFLQATVRRAALPDEDIFWEEKDILEALDRGFPRLVVHAADDPHPVERRLDQLRPELPRLTLTSPALRAWEAARRNQGFAVSRVDDHGMRLRQLMQSTVGPLPWVEGVFRDLVRVGGQRLPRGLRGLGRRVMEFPARYDDLGAVAKLTGLSRGALKARFRRRELPSPYTYLRWFRILALAHVFKDPETTTEEAARRVGLHSSGNLCRYVDVLTGMSARALRADDARIRLVTAFSEACFRGVDLAEWSSLEDLFLARVA